MGYQANPVLLRQVIGRKIRAAREAAGLNLTDAAKELEIARSSLCRLENAQAILNVHLARSMMDVYDVYDDELLDLIRRARQVGWWKQYGMSDKHFPALEAGARQLSNFEPNLIHGLLQVKDYALALFRAGMKTRTESWIANQVTARMVRQERLVDECQPLSVSVVVGEFALRLPVGGPATMRAQLRHLTLVTELPTVTLQVLPASVVTTSAYAGAFTILDFSSIQPAIAYAEHALAWDRTDNPDQVASARLRFDHLRSLALGPQESIALIEQVAETMWAD